MAEWRLSLEFAYIDPFMEGLYPNGDSEWEVYEPYVEERRFGNEETAREMYKEAKEILDRADSNDATPSQAQKDFPIKHGFALCDDDGNCIDAQLALIAIQDFLKVENLMIEDEEEED